MRRASCRRPTLAGTFTDLINKPEVTLTRLRVPRGVTTVFGMDGQRYVARDGVVAVPPDDVPPLLRAGFVRV